MKQRLINLYLDYFNNFITVQAFASYYYLTEEKALRVIELGRKINNK